MDVEMLERCATLTEEQKLAVTQIGCETVLRAFGVMALAHTTLKGHLYYVSEDSPTMIDTLLHTLEGSGIARDRMSAFLNSDEFRDVPKTLHHMSTLKVSERDAQ